MFLFAAPILLVLGRESAPKLAPRAAVRAAKADTQVRDHLRDHPYTRTVVTRLERDVQRVSFFHGSRLVLDAAVSDEGKIESVAPRFGGNPPTGNPVAHRHWLWAVWTAALLWLLAGRGLRLVDALALCGLVLAVLTYDDALVAPTIWIAAPMLGWLALRCAQVGFAGVKQPSSEPPPPLSPRLIGIAAGIAALTLTLTSPAVSDVGFASMAGGTLLLHGVLPYGHMPSEVFHGDTYPLLNYVVHAPLAVWHPVWDSFSDTTGALVVAAIGLVLAAAGIHRTATKLWGPAAGWRLAAAFLVLPATVISASSGSNDLLLAAGVAWLLALMAHPRASTLVLTLAAWIKLIPVILAPLWVARLHGRRRAAAVVAICATVPLVLWLLALDGSHAIAAMLNGLSFQADRGSLFAVWTQVAAGATLQRIFQAAVVAFLAASAVALWRDPARARDPVVIAGFLGALLLAVQLAANYWTFAYLPWAMPCVLIALFGPRQAS